MHIEIAYIKSGGGGKKTDGETGRVQFTLHVIVLLLYCIYSYHDHYSGTQGEVPTYLLRWK